MLLTVGDLLEEILIQLRSPPRQGVDSTVRSARVRGGSAANVAAIDAERAAHLVSSDRSVTTHSARSSRMSWRVAGSTSRCHGSVAPVSVSPPSGEADGRD